MHTYCGIDVLSYLCYSSVFCLSCSSIFSFAQCFHTSSFHCNSPVTLMASILLHFLFFMYTLLFSTESYTRASILVNDDFLASNHCWRWFCFACLYNFSFIWQNANILMFSVLCSEKTSMPFKLCVSS